jgi:hypothetical protein
MGFTLERHGALRSAEAGLVRCSAAPRSRALAASVPLVSLARVHSTQIPLGS